MKRLLRKHEALGKPSMKQKPCGFYEAKHTCLFRVAKPRFMGKAHFIFHTPQVCFIRPDSSRRELSGR